MSVLALVLALFAVDIPSPAPAPAAVAPVPTAFAYFERYCLSNPGDPAKALAAAATDGWMPIPRKMLPPAPSWVLEAKARMRSDATASYMMMAGRAAYPYGDETWETAMCSIEAGPADAAAIKLALDHWIGAGPDLIEDGMASYAFADEAGRRKRLKPNDPETDRQFRSGALRIVSMYVDGERVELFLASPLRPTDPVATSGDGRAT